MVTSLRWLDGTKRNRTSIVVTVGRSMSGRTVVMVGDTAAELDAREEFGPIVGVSEVLRGSCVEVGGDR